MYYAFNFWQLHTITLTASWRHVPGMAFQVCVVMEGLWFKIVTEDFTLICLYWLLPCPWLPGGHRLGRLPLPCSSPLEVERGCPSSVAGRPILLAQPTGSTGAFQLTGNLDIRSWENQA